VFELLAMANAALALERCVKTQHSAIPGKCVSARLLTQGVTANVQQRIHKGPFRGAYIHTLAGLLPSRSRAMPIARPKSGTTMTNAGISCTSQCVVRSHGTTPPLRRM
jgi:hypothetical protein